MKKITLSILFAVCCGALSLSARAQIVVTDPTSLAQILALTNTAAQQVTALTTILDIAKETAEARKRVQSVVKTASDVNKLIRLGQTAVGDIQFLLNFVTRGPQVVSPRIALRYSELCISTTENMIGYVERATTLITDNIFDASDAERVTMMDNLEKKMKEDMERLAQERARVERDERMRKLSNFVINGN